MMRANYTLGKNYPQIASQMHFLEVKSRNQGPTRLDRVTALAYIREPTQANATIGNLSNPALQTCRCIALLDRLAMGICFSNGQCNGPFTA